jgi:hypothetical protein
MQTAEGVTAAQHGDTVTCHDVLGNLVTLHRHAK